jgi:hypothetical protein
MLKLSLVFVAFVLSACAANHSESSGGADQKPGGKGEVPPDPTKPTNTHGIYGVWEGSGRDTEGSNDYKLSFSFEPGRVTLKKECIFSGGRFTGSLTVNARAATTDNGDGNHVALAGSLSAFSTIDGASCAVDFPYGMEFFIRDGKMVVRLLDAERVTSLKKTAEL